MDIPYALVGVKWFTSELPNFKVGFGDRCLPFTAVDEDCIMLTSSQV